MIVIPQRLFTAPGVEVLARDGNNCILHKRLPREQRDREAYVANHVVSLVLSGRQMIRTYEERTVTARAGEALLLSRGVYYVTDLLPDDGPFESLLFYFDDDALHRFLSVTNETEVDPERTREYLHFTPSPALAAFVTHTRQTAAAGLLTKPILGIKTLELLHLLHGLSESRTCARFLFRLTLPKRRNLRQFMERNYRKPLGVEDYAYLTGRSVSSFRRDFREFFGTTPNRWLRRRRMQEAVALLEAGDRSVTELSYAVGYENISYFIREFRKVTGLSPKQYMLARRETGTPPADA